MFSRHEIIHMSKKSKDNAKKVINNGFVINQGRIQGSYRTGARFGAEYPPSKKIELLTLVFLLREQALISEQGRKFMIFSKMNRL